MPAVLDTLTATTLPVFLAEIGDKTQLLSFVLAARFRKPLPIILGILVATLANHAGASWVGRIAGDMLDAKLMRWVVGLAFIAIGVWVLRPDREEDLHATRFGEQVFIATTVLFFLAEMGDKTQIATVLLGARYESVLLVTLGTTLGMLLANIPAVMIGEKLLARLPLKHIRYTAAVVFVVLGLLTLWFGIAL